MAHSQFRWFGGGWKVNAELPGPSALDLATSFVRRRPTPSADAHIGMVEPEPQGDIAAAVVADHGKPVVAQG